MQALEIDSGDKLELFAPTAMPHQAFADLFFAVKKSFVAQDLTLQNSIISTANKAVDGVESKHGSAYFTSINELLMSVLECDTTVVWMAKRRVFVEVWVRWLETILSLNQKEKHETFILSTGRRFF